MPDQDDHPVPAPSGSAETSLDTVALVASAFPGLGGVVANLLAGMANDRKLLRVHEVLVGFAEDLRDLRSETAEQYAKAEEFADLLDTTVRRAAEARTAEKRQLYRAFLVGAAAAPVPYDEQLRVLRVLDEIQPQHVHVLRALVQEPVEEGRLMGSPLQTLHRRMPDLSRDTIKELAAQLTDLRLTGLGDSYLHTMMTAHGAEDLRHTVTPLGQRLIAFLLIPPEK